MKIDWLQTCRHLTGLFRATCRKSRTLTFYFFVLILIALVGASCSKGSKEKPVPLGQNDRAKITGKVSLLWNKLLKAELYNGTDWTLTDVDVEMRYPDPNIL